MWGKTKESLQFDRTLRLKLSLFTEIISNTGIEVTCYNMECIFGSVVQTLENAGCNVLTVSFNTRRPSMAMSPREGCVELHWGVYA